MSVLTEKISRDHLLREIFVTLRQWSELERNVFARAHYHGQSLNAISRSLRLDMKEVKAILRQCDRQLYSSLREFRKNSFENHLAVHAETAEMVARSQDLGSGRELQPKACKNPGASRMAI